MWQNPQFPADLVKFTEEIINGKLHFLCSVINYLSILNKSIEHWKRLESSFAVLLVDFNARSKSCYPDDIKSMEDTHLDSLGWTDGLHQLILEPRYILPNFSSCIYLIFTDEINLTPAETKIYITQFFIMYLSHFYGWNKLDTCWYSVVIHL